MTSRCAVICLLAIAIAACSKRDAERRPAFETWRAAADHARETDAYAGFLDTRGVGDVLPMRELLRSGRRWHRCDRDAFAVPPRARWPAMVSTLELVVDLRSHGLLDAPRVASVYRDAAFNRCEGGSPQSRHLANNAIDFDLATGRDGIARLCGYWRKHGRAKRFGLGFYNDHQIHVDTSGYRTWGGDYTRRTSLCARKPG